MNFYDSLFVFCFGFGVFVLDNRKDTWGEWEIVCDFFMFVFVYSYKMFTFASKY